MCLAGQDRGHFLVLPVGEPYILGIAHRKRPCVSQAIRASEQACREHFASGPR